jgi:hypothetical protein
VVWCIRRWFWNRVGLRWRIVKRPPVGIDKHNFYHQNFWIQVRMCRDAAQSEDKWTFLYQLFNHAFQPLFSGAPSRVGMLRNIHHHSAMVGTCYVASPPLRVEMLTFVLSRTVAELALSHFPLAKGSWSSPFTYCLERNFVYLIHENTTNCEC